MSQGLLHFCINAENPQSGKSRNDGPALRQYAVARFYFAGFVELIPSPTNAECVLDANKKLTSQLFSPRENFDRR